jgi:hypothetical protein
MQPTVYVEYCGSPSELHKLCGAVWYKPLYIAQGLYRAAGMQSTDSRMLYP